MTVTEQLRQAIDESGRSRYALAKETGIHVATLHRFYYGEGNLSADGIDKLADALGLELTRKRPATRKGTKKGKPKGRRGNAPK